MRILVYNWRDIENPNAGGAELFTHEVLKRLVHRGHETTLFTSKYKGAPDEEVIDGVEVIRSGGRFTVYRQAIRKYRQLFRGEFDLVIDEINTRPFMTPKFVDDVPIIALIHQLAREFWFYETPFPISHLGYYWLEDRWLSRYTNIPTITVSESTMEDLIDLGFEEVSIVPEGLSVEPLDEVPDKADVPTFIFVGRMTEAKRPAHALKAFQLISDEFPNSKLHMVGDGYLMDDLKTKSNGNVEFHGYVTDQKKFELMKNSHLLLVPGVREGWGLVVTEANAMGTPAIGYDIPGLRDSINHRETGLLCETNPQAMANSISTIFSENINEYSRTALMSSKRFEWDESANKFESILNGVLRG